MSPLITTRAGASANAYGWGAASAVATSFQSIATVTAAGGETSLSLTSIPSTFTHLQIRGISHDTHTSGVLRAILFRANTDTGSNYSRYFLQGDGSTTTAGSTINTTFINLRGCSPDDGGNANNFGSIDVSILDYANTTKYKNVRGLVGAEQNGVGQVSYISGLWINTAAITSLQFYAEAVAFKAGTTFALYGIKESA